MFGCQCDHVATAMGTKTRAADDGKVVCLGCAGGKNQLARRNIQQRCEGIARALDDSASAATGPVNRSGLPSCSLS